MKTEGFTRRRPSALAVVAAAAAGVSLLAIPNCAGLQASSASLQNGVEGTSLSSRGEYDAAKNVDQSGLRADEDGPVVNVSHHVPAGRMVAQRRSSSAYSLAAGSSSFPRSLGSIFLAASAAAAAMSLFGSERKGEAGGFEEELLRQSAAAAAAGTAAGLPKSVLSKEVLLSLAAFGLLFLASSLAAPSGWTQAEVTMHYQCTPGNPNECKLDLYEGADGVTHTLPYKTEATNLVLKFPPDYKPFLDEHAMEVFATSTVLRHIVLEGRHTSSSEGSVDVTVPVPPGVDPSVFNPPPGTWVDRQVTFHFECTSLRRECTMHFPNTGKVKFGATRTADVTRGAAGTVIKFRARLPGVFRNIDPEYSGKLRSYVREQGKALLAEWNKRGLRHNYAGTETVTFPIPPGISPNIFRTRATRASRVRQPVTPAAEEIFELQAE